MTVSHAIEQPRDDLPGARWEGPVVLHGSHYGHHTDGYHDASGTGGAGTATAPTYSGPTYSGPPYTVPTYTPPTYVAPQNGRLARLVVRMAERSPRWLAPASIAVCFAGVASYVWVSNPTDGGAADIDTCLVKMTTGFDCPGCGGTRAFYYLLNGNIPEAARHHAIAVFAAPFLVWLYVAWAIQRTTGKQIPAPRIGARAASVFLGAWALFMVVRNLPWAPFTSLYV